MLNGFESDIPLLEPNERLKKMITAPPEILENIANNILQEIGKNDNRSSVGEHFVTTYSQHKYGRDKGTLTFYIGDKGIIITRYI